MFDDRETTEARIRRFIQHDLIPHIHQQTAPVRLRALRLPGEPIPPREAIAQLRDQGRSEERRVGKECRSGWSPNHYKEEKTRYQKTNGMFEANDIRHIMLLVETGMNISIDY